VKKDSHPRRKHTKKDIRKKSQNVQEILFGKCFKNFLHSKPLAPLSRFAKFSLVSAILLSSYYAEKFSKTLAQVHSYVVCIQSRRNVQK